ncbi:MAG: ferrous iron transport protein A [Anaerolineae bacterium]|nr:ferrous iron transport protein A [Anaerolineae bacterium]
MTQQSISLAKLAAQEVGMMVELRGGAHFVSRMATLGFTPGAPLTMVQNFGHGPLIVLVRDARIALGRGEANKIMVRKRDHHG